MLLTAQLPHPTPEASLKSCGRDTLQAGYTNHYPLGNHLLLTHENCPVCTPKGNRAGSLNSGDDPRSGTCRGQFAQAGPGKT